MTETFNKAIKDMMAAGLISKWATDYNFNWPRPDNLISKVSARNLVGVYILCGSGIIGSVIFAFTEQIIYQKANVRNAKHFWILADKLVDGKRYLFVRR